MPRKCKPLAERFWAQVAVSGEHECWPWRSKSMVKGYGTIGLGGRNAGKDLAHRVAWILTHGPLPQIPGHHGAVVMHTCDNRLCCNPAHLIVGTQGDNVVDMDRKGRRINSQLKGSRHHNAKLTESDVIAIRQDPRPHPDVAADYGVTPENIGMIRKRVSWRHVG